MGGLARHGQALAQAGHRRGAQEGAQPRRTPTKSVPRQTAVELLQVFRTLTGETYFDPTLWSATRSSSFVTSSNPVFEPRPLFAAKRDGELSRPEKQTHSGPNEVRRPNACGRRPRRSSSEGQRPGDRVACFSHSQPVFILRPPANYSLHRRRLSTPRRQKNDWPVGPNNATVNKWRCGERPCQPGRCPSLDERLGLRPQVFGRRVWFAESASLQTVRPRPLSHRNKSVFSEAGNRCESREPRSLGNAVPGKAGG